jgi:hypothetical protein
MVRLTPETPTHLRPLERGDEVAPMDTEPDAGRVAGPRPDPL